MREAVERLLAMYGASVLLGLALIAGSALLLRACAF